MSRRHQEERQRATRLSDIVDSLVVQRRRSADESTVCGDQDRELDHLASLAAELSSIVLKPDPGFRDRLFRRLSVARPSRMFSGVFSGFGIVRSLGVGMNLAPVFAVVAVVAVLVLIGRGLPAAASEILTKSDEAIGKLVQPGKLLFRRWRIVERIRERPDAPEQVVERFTLEWIDGSDIRHAAGKSLTSSGHMYLAYANVLDHGRYVPRMYYEPGFADEPRGLLSIVPSREEFEAAAARFEGHERAIVDTYLARGYIYQPIVSERRFNDAMLKPSVGPEPIPQVLLSVDSSALINNVPVHRVRSIEPVRVPFRWSSTGPPNAWLERQETVRYIAKDSFLTLRAEETIEAESGRRVYIVRELVATETLDMPARAEDNPFDLDAVDHVPVRRQSAFEHLSQVTRTLRRAPAFLARHRATFTEEH